MSQWPREIDPNLIVLMGTLGVRDHQLDRDPIVYPTVAEEINLRSSDSFDGRYKKTTKEIHGHFDPKRQDTYITGTADRTGRAFNVNSGTWHSDFQTEYSGVYGIKQQDSTKDITYAVTSNDTTVGIENCTMFIGRGSLPSVSPSYEFTKDNTYMYVYLAWGSKIDFRIAFEYRKPVRIDRTNNTWSTFEQVAVASSLGDTERFFATNQHKMPVDVYVDRVHNQLVVELGDGSHLSTTPYNPFDGHDEFDENFLPKVGKIRLAGANGWCSFEYYPKVYKPLTIKIRKDIRVADHPRSSEATIVTNNRAEADPTQTVTATITPNGKMQEVDLTITQPDTSQPAKLVDATLIIPAQWSNLSTAGNSDAFYPRGITLEYHQKWDHITHTFWSDGNLILDNSDNAYTGLWGNKAVDIWGSAGDSFYKIFTGIAGDGPGVQLFKVDTMGRISCPITDLGMKMKHPINTRLILDRMCLYNAIHLVATIGGIHQDNLNMLPQYIPPGCTPEAPWGPAGVDCPYPVLASGSGTHARFEFGPETHAWDIFQLLIQDQGRTDFFGTTSVPFYGGFDLNGYLRAEAFDPGNLVPVVFFTERDDTGLAQIQSINMTYSTEGMRTQIDFEGINPWSNALETYHIDQPEYTKIAVGYPSRWVERNPRYSGDYLIAAAKNAGAMSAIPQLSGNIGATWIPYVSAGQRVAVYDQNTLGYVLDAYIDELHATISMCDVSGQGGHRVCSANYHVRATANTPHIPGIIGG